MKNSSAQSTDNNLEIMQVKLHKVNLWLILYFTEIILNTQMHTGEPLPPQIWALIFSPDAHDNRLCISEYSLEPFGQFSAISRQHEAIVCNRIKGGEGNILAFTFKVKLCP